MKFFKKIFNFFFTFFFRISSQFFSKIVFRMAFFHDCQTYLCSFFFRSADLFISLCWKKNDTFCAICTLTSYPCFNGLCTKPNCIFWNGKQNPRQVLLLYGHWKAMQEHFDEICMKICFFNHLRSIYCCESKKNWTMYNSNACFVLFASLADLVVCCGFCDTFYRCADKTYVARNSFLNSTSTWKN